MKRLLLALIILIAFVSEARAAITFANLGTSANPDINDGVDRDNYDTTSWTPPTSGLIIVCVTNRGLSGGGGVQPTITGNSLTWTAIKTQTAASDTRLTMFGANATGSAAGVTTVDFAANDQQYAGVSFFAATGVDLTGGVAAAFVQSPTGTGTSNAPTVTLAAAGHADNRPIFCVAGNNNEAVAPRTNWTEADDLAGTVRFFESQYRQDAFETTAGATWTTSGNYRAIAAEIKATVEASTRRPIAPVVFP